MPALKFEILNDSLSTMTDDMSGQLDEIEFPNMLQLLIRNENCSLIECALKPFIIISGLVFNLLWIILVLNKKQTSQMDSHKPFRYLLIAICVSHIWFLFDQFNFWIFAYFNRPDLTSFNGSCQFGSYFNYFFKVSIELHMLTANYILIRFCLRNYLNKANKAGDTLYTNSMDIYNQFQIDYEPEMPRSSAKTPKCYLSSSLASSSSVSASISPSSPISSVSLSTRQANKKGDKRRRENRNNKAMYSLFFINFFRYSRRKQPRRVNETRQGEEEKDEQNEEQREEKQLFKGNSEERNVSLVDVVSEETEVTRNETWSRNLNSTQLKPNPMNQSQPGQQQETMISDPFAQLKSSHQFLKLVETNKFNQEEVYFNIVIKEKMFIILITIVLLYMLSFILWIKGVSSLKQQQQEQPDFPTSTSHAAINLCVTYAFGKPLLNCLNMFVLVLRLLNLVINVIASFVYHWKFGKEYFRSMLNSFGPSKLDMDLEEEVEANDNNVHKKREASQPSNRPGVILLGKQLKFIYSFRSQFNLQHLRSLLDANKKLSQSSEAFLDCELKSSQTNQESKSKENVIKLRKFQLHYDHFEFVRFYAISILFYTLLIAPSVLNQTYSKYNELRETLFQRASKDDSFFVGKFQHISDQNDLKLKLNSLIDSSESNKAFSGLGDHNPQWKHETSRKKSNDNLSDREKEEKEEELVIKKLLFSLSKFDMNEKRSTAWTDSSANQTLALNIFKQTPTNIHINNNNNNNSSMLNSFLSNLIKSNGENGDSHWSQFVTLTELLAHSLNLLVYLTFSVHLKCSLKYYATN